MALILSIILGILFAACLLRLIFLKREIRQMNLSLKAIVEIDTNAQLTVATLDRHVAAFAETINTMLERNRRDHFEKLRTETELKRAITNISHDLRTPLTSARGYLQMLESSELDAETRNRYLAIIQERLDALSVLMNSLFEFARVIEGNLVFDVQKVNVCNAVYDALSASYEELERKGFTVDIDLPETPVVWFCDTDALRRILHNLIQNACIHGKEYLRVRLDRDRLEIANKADGIGELDTERLFDRFYTADASRSNKRTGLGLAIVRGLAEQMGGRVSAQAEDDMLAIRVALPRGAT
jgi:signal transduction histidine kinase